MIWTTPAPSRETLAGRLIDAFCEGIREAMPDYDQPLTVFGSAAIQLCYVEHFTSADIDLMVIAGGERLRQLAGELGLGRSGSVKFLTDYRFVRPCFFAPRPNIFSELTLKAEMG